MLEEWAVGECQDCSLLIQNCDDRTTIDFEECAYLFALFDLEDSSMGIILIIISLFILCISLLLMVKMLTSLLKGAVAVVIKRVINPEFKSPVFNYLYGYFNIVIGALMTFIVQSSSVFTSTLTPLVGIGLITVETVYPLFLGSNIGTTTTSILAALAGSGRESIMNSLQIAFVHLFFNVFGILIFYPLPFLR